MREEDEDEEEEAINLILFMFNSALSIKLDGVGPVDNRPSTN